MTADNNDVGQRDPLSLVDGYLIAHGMARSYVLSGRAGPAELDQLIKYDRAASLAAVTADLEPGDMHRAQAEEALERLLDYTARNDLAPDAARKAPPPVR